MDNAAIAAIFRNIAVILELKGDNPFRIRAYEKAAQNIESLNQNLKDLAKENRLTAIPGIGTDLANKINEIIATGTLAQYEELKKSIPQGLIKMLQIPGLGPKTIKAIYQKMHIETIEELKKAAKGGKLTRIPHLKEKTQENILKGIALLENTAQRLILPLALEIAEKYFYKPLKQLREIEKIEIAGSLRRRKDTIGDIDILASSKKPNKVMGFFTSLGNVKDILAKGPTKSSIVSKEGFQVDLRVIKKESFGSALLYFTGAKQFNINLRQLALKKGYKINEYGVFKKNEPVAGKTEKEIFSFFKMQYIPPVLREDRGEIDLALKHKLPKLIELKDIRGDLHIHSTYSDGSSTIEEIARKAKTFGYDYVAITDHSRSLKVANGLSIERLYQKKKAIEKLNKKLKGIRILCGSEVDILSDGQLDYPNEVLKDLDIVIAAIHTGFKQSKKQLTTRIIKALKNKYTHIIAHPTGRLWGVRPEYEIDLEEIFKVASEYGKAMEINCYPKRLDLNDINVLKAKSAGVKLALGSDTHIIDQMNSMQWGITVAQRGWLIKENVINTLSLDNLQKWLKR